MINTVILNLLQTSFGLVVEKLKVVLSCLYELAEYKMELMTLLISYMKQPLDSQNVQPTYVQPILLHFEKRGRHWESSNPAHFLYGGLSCKNSSMAILPLLLIQEEQKIIVS